MTERQPLIIDTDPGQDDAVAILLALASPEIHLLGITTVAGNVPLDLTEVNARKICDLAGRQDVPVFAGLSRPLVRRLVTAEHVHGRTGLDGPDLPPPQTPLQEQHAVDFIIETVRKEPSGSVTIAPIGPLSNIAMALQRAPDIAPRIKQIVLMGGGCFEGGNITPAAEFNIYVDPHAAAVVFGAGIPITMMPLDVTHKALTTEKRNEALARYRQPHRYGRRRDARFFREVRRGKIRQRRRTASRPLHGGMDDRARIVHRQAL